MKPLNILACATALVALAGCNSRQGSQGTSEAPVKYENVTPPPGGNWTDVINPTPAGGVMMGNPNAKVHLIEIGSLTCPHCQHFEETAVDDLVNKYVKTGSVSYEFRNYVRDAFDLAAVIVSKCNGPKSFFPLSRAFYDTHPDWEQKAMAFPQDQLTQLQSLPPARVELQAAKMGGFIDWAAARGVPQAKTTQCLTDTKRINEIVNQSGMIAQDYPDFAGTPSFVLNGTMVDLGGVPEDKIWPFLEGKIKGALGG